MRMNGHNLSTGTGFVVNAPRGPVLVTNRHNVTGRHNTTNALLSPQGHIPDEIIIMHNRNGNLGQWVAKSEPILNDYNPLWIEHPTLGATADFVALPLTNLTDVKLYPYDLTPAARQIIVRPSDTISVIGFPFGIAGGGALGIWATGFMATEHDIDHNNLPTFLIDCRARQGQSGSAVIAHRNTGMMEAEDGTRFMSSGAVTRFMGIYSGRINDQSDLGIVWKARAISELIATIV
jgi:hypothetical protein